MQAAEQIGAVGCWRGVGAWLRLPDGVGWLDPSLRSVHDAIAPWQPSMPGRAPRT